MGRPASGSETKDEQTVPNPPRGTTLICSADFPRRSDKIGSHAAQSSGPAGSVVLNRSR
jgi:hypothetical protein